MIHHHLHLRPESHHNLACYIRSSLRLLIVVWLLDFGVYVHYLNSQQRDQWRMRGWLFIFVSTILGSRFGVPLVLNVPDLTWDRLSRNNRCSSSISTIVLALAVSSGR